LSGAGGGPWGGGVGLAPGKKKTKNLFRGESGFALGAFGGKKLGPPPPPNPFFFFGADSKKKKGGPDIGRGIFFKKGKNPNNPPQPPSRGAFLLVVLFPGGQKKTKPGGTLGWAAAAVRNRPKNFWAFGGAPIDFPKKKSPHKTRRFQAKKKQVFSPFSFLPPETKKFKKKKKKTWQGQGGGAPGGPPLGAPGGTPRFAGGGFHPPPNKLGSFVGRPATGRPTRGGGLRVPRGGPPKMRQKGGGGGWGGGKNWVFFFGSRGGGGVGKPVSFSGGHEENQTPQRRPGGFASLSPHPHCSLFFLLGGRGDPPTNTRDWGKFFFHALFLSFGEGGGGPPPRFCCHGGGRF